MKPPAPPFEKGNKAAVLTADRAARKAWREQAAWDMEQHLHRLALNAEREDTQVAAAAKLHAICDGLPTQRVLTENVARSISEYSDAELRAIAGDGEEEGFGGAAEARARPN